MKKSITMITLLLLIAGILSGCSNKPNEDSQQESVQTAVPGTENPTAEPEPEETQPKFDVAQDVLLSYEYDSNGEISKVIFTYREDASSEGEIAEFSEIKTIHDTNGYLTSITAASKSTPSTGSFAYSMEATYNTDGQIISLICQCARWVEDSVDLYSRNYEVVYNPSDNNTKVYITYDYSQLITTEIYDSNCCLLSREEFTRNSTGRLERSYTEYVNGIRSHLYQYDDSTGRLLTETVYHDNGNISEFYSYDENTGEIKNHSRYDRNGDPIKQVW